LKDVNYYTYGSASGNVPSLTKIEIFIIFANLRLKTFGYWFYWDDKNWKPSTFL